MANIRTLMTIGVLVTLGSKASVAMPPQEVPAEVKSCKAISDDKARLRCFDGLFEGPSKLQKPPDEKQVKKTPEEKPENWSIEEATTDGSPKVVAANLANDTVLILRCKDQITEAAFSTQFNYLGYKSVDVQLLINDQNPTKEVWKASMDGRAAFAPDAIAFIESLPDNGNLSIRRRAALMGK
jgi:hypothetical protein